MVNVKIEITGTTDGFEHYYGKIVSNNIVLSNWAYSPARTMGKYILRYGETSSLLEIIFANNFHSFLRKLKAYLNMNKLDFDYLEAKKNLKK